MICWVSVHAMQERATPGELPMWAFNVLSMFWTANWVKSGSLKKKGFSWQHPCAVSTRIPINRQWCGGIGTQLCRFVSLSHRNDFSWWLRVILSPMASLPPSTLWRGQVLGKMNLFSACAKVLVMWVSLWLYLSGLTFYSQQHMNIEIDFMPLPLVVGE